MAKQATAPPQEDSEEIVADLRQLSQIDPKVLETAERYPTMAKALIDAAKT
jgi:hypothetical protein